MRVQRENHGLLSSEDLLMSLIMRTNKEHVRGSLLSTSSFAAIAHCHKMKFQLDNAQLSLSKTSAAPALAKDSFTQFVQAFHDKDLTSLGKIHVAFLMLLISDIEAELANGSLPHLNKSCNFHALLHSIESQEYSLDFWRRSLNSRTWLVIE
ncbi:hypothetical protein VNO77_44230 [Canavalia gladiata]|uniref:Uncharacterized protein n=1 Tax=Canavalia gladiata TaxID=3824 RepID=A0AAN9PQK2_CANGL